MGDSAQIAEHYQSGQLLARLQAALRSDGVDPERPSLAALAPYDHFHGRGLEATEQLAEGRRIEAGHHLLDVGSGIGGPARFFAARLGCRVTGIDLTEEFCAVARHLTELLGLGDRVAFRQGDAVAMPFGDDSFDGAYSMNVSMNIADKAGLYAALYRVLRPGGWLALSEVTDGPGDGPAYPTPWARTAASSFLSTPEETRAGLEAAGFRVLSLEDRVAESRDYAARSKAAVERGGKPPHRAVSLIHGEIAEAAIANAGRASAAGALIPIEVVCEKPAEG